MICKIVRPQKLMWHNNDKYNREASKAYLHNIMKSSKRVSYSGLKRVSNSSYELKELWFNKYLQLKVTWLGIRHYLCP